LLFVTGFSDTLANLAQEIFFEGYPGMMYLLAVEGPVDVELRDLGAATQGLDGTN
jgi:hypothetical protein